jgi:hypothetical protein
MLKHTLPNVMDSVPEKSPGTLEGFATHGVGNPQDFVSGRFSKLLKFQSLKSKEFC